VAVADRFPGTPWGEEALLSLANHYQKDALDDSALPWWRRLAAEYPQGRYVERAAWRTGWGDYRARRYESAARLFETTARLRPPSGSTAGFLYWSARSRLAMGQTDRARALLAETIQRYKHAYHGVRASEALARLGGRVAPHAVLVATTPAPEAPLPEPRATRARQLLLLERLTEAAQELRLLPDSPRVQATLAWVDWRQGRYRPAITAMKRAYPEWVGEAGDRLPAGVWQILFPLRYDREVRLAAQDEGVDPALVAALILQESSFDAGALSRAGARGLMQVMPATGRSIARAKGKRFRRAALHDPETSLDFGTHYLRQMSQRYSGAAEKVLAAYNAGPHRVDAWTALRGELNPEEFIESIPFNETRNYVMIVLANREQYRRLYGLVRTTPGPVSEGARP
jgi:soluble lytic murein transglycosylase